MHVDESGWNGEYPRPLNGDEYHIMTAILNDTCPGASTLRAQLETARVLRNWLPPGSPSIDLEVAASAPKIPQDGRPRFYEVHSRGVLVGVGVRDLIGGLTGPLAVIETRFCDEIAGAHGVRSK